MDNELGRTCKEVVVAQYEVLSPNLPGGTEENSVKLQAGEPVQIPRFEPRTS
jgi:hypothetical protein